MSEKQVIRIIHILTGLLFFMIAVAVIFGAAYFGVSKLQAGKDKDQAQQEDERKEETTTEEEVEEISSKGKMIGVYNGANINGLAGRWSKKLMEEGYRIEIIENYDDTLETGKLIVKEKGMGLDLQREYFPDAQIEVGTPDEDLDIQIILGKSEDDE